jgi:hypothetical protein
VAEQTPPLDPTSLLPAAEALSQGPHPEHPGCLRHSRRQPPEHDRQHIGADRVVLANEPQRSPVPGGEYGPSVPTLSAAIGAGAAPNT